MKRLVLTLVLALSAVSWAVNGNLGDGDGSAGNPYLIEDLADFDAFANPANAGTYWVNGSHTKLMTDIDLSGKTFLPMGNSTTIFTGTFDGTGHIISNITINMPNNDYVGLFGRVCCDAEINNLGAKNVNVTGHDNVGAICGYFGDGNGPKMENCYVEGLVVGNKSVGGLVGYANYGSIINCYAEGTIIGSSDGIGGLAGYMRCSGIVDSYFIGSVKGNSRVGGMFGDSWYGGVQGCYSKVTVNGNAAIGGMVGLLYGSIENSFTECSVTGSGPLGGLVGMACSPKFDPSCVRG